MGNGFTTGFVDGPKVRGIATVNCQRCQGAGEIDHNIEARIKIGGVHRTWRVAKHEGLAACAERLGIDPRDLNDMEHGRKDPAPLLADIPEILRKYENLPNPSIGKTA
jgi:hypothetical protein